MKKRNEREKTYMVLLIDRKQAIMFGFKSAKAYEKEVFLKEDVPQNVKANEEHFYGRSDKIVRHIEDHLHRHLVDASAVAKAYWEKGDFDGIIIGTHKPLFTKITNHLSSAMRNNVRGKFIIDFKKPFGKMLKNIQLFVERIERMEEIQTYENYFIHN